MTRPVGPSRALGNALFGRTGVVDVAGHARKAVTGCEAAGFAGHLAELTDVAQHIVSIAGADRTVADASEPVKKVASVAGNAVLGAVTGFALGGTQLTDSLVFIVAIITITALIPVEVPNPAADTLSF